MIRVKICCISSLEEALVAVQCGASALGLVSEMPSGPGVISESRIAKIAATVPPPVGAFLLTSRTDPAEIAAQCTGGRTNGRLDEGKLRKFIEAVESAAQQIAPADRQPATWPVGS